MATPELESSFNYQVTSRYTFLYIFLRDIKTETETEIELKGKMLCTENFSKAVKSSSFLDSSLSDDHLYAPNIRAFIDLGGNISDLNC